MPRKNSRKNVERTVALCYVRQSYTRDENDTNSPERQRANLQVVCDQHNWTPEWYEDAEGHKSGTKVKNRPGWLALEKRLSDPDVIALVANDLSRLHRKGWRIGNLLDIVDEHDIHLVLAAPGKQIDFNSPQGRAVAQLSAIFDEWYAEDISMRSVDSVLFRKNKGITVGIPPFGTTRGDDGFLVPLEDGAWLLPSGDFVAGDADKCPEDGAIWRCYYDAAKRVLELYATDAMGVNKVAFEMQAEGWAFRDRYNNPRPFNGDDVRRILANWQEYGGLVTDQRALDRHPFDYKLDEITLDEEKAVFDVELLYRIGQVRHRRSVRRPVKDKVNTKAYPYPLSNIVRCYHCETLADEKSDDRLRSKLSGKKNGKGIRRYRHKHGVDCGCTNRSVMADILETEFATLIKMLTIKEEELDLLETLALIASQIDGDIRDHDRIEAQKRSAIAKCQRRIEAAKTLYLEGDLSYAEYQRRKDENQREIELWQARTQDVEQVAMELAICVEAVQKISTIWQYADDEDRQGMAQNLFEYVIFDLDTHRITDFRLKPWADRFITVRAALYDGETKTLIQEFLDEGNHVTPTGFEPRPLHSSSSELSSLLVSLLYAA